MIGAIDLTAVTGELTAVGTAVLAAAAVAIVAALSLMAVRFGGAWVVGIFKRLSK